MHYPTRRGGVYLNWERCRTCNGTDVVESEGPDDPAPTTITVGGVDVEAPGFTSHSFDRAIMRAHDAGLRVAATDRADMVLVTNRAHATAYTVSRSQCSFKAGQRGVGCKHRALAIFLADICHDLPADLPVAA